MKKLILFLYVLIHFNSIYSQSFGIIDYRLGISSLVGQSESFSSFYTGAGINCYLNLKNSMLLSIGINFGSNAVYNIDNSFSYNNYSSYSMDEDEEEIEDGSVDYSFLGYMFLNIGNVQFPIKIGKLMFNETENVGCLISGGFIPEILLSKEFNYTDNYFRMKNSLGVGIGGDVGLLFRVSDAGNYFITSLSYYRLLTKYSDYPSGQNFTRWALSLNLGMVLFF